MKTLLSHLRCTLLLGFAVTAHTVSAEWKITKGDTADLPGQNVSVTHNGKLVARFIHGEGQNLPYLAIYDDAGRLLTNSGLDKDGKTVGIEPHHRGIFIGWQQIKSDLGTANVWNLPTNPVEEFSTREYGRFGFFFNRDLKKAEPLEVKYRFLVREAAAPESAPKRSASQIRDARQTADAAYAAFIREVK